MYQVLYYIIYILTWHTNTFLIHDIVFTQWTTWYRYLRKFSWLTGLPVYNMQVSIHLHCSRTQVPMSPLLSSLSSLPVPLVCRLQVTGVFSFRSCRPCTLLNSLGPVNLRFALPVEVLVVRPPANCVMNERGLFLVVLSSCVESGSRVWNETIVCESGGRFQHEDVWLQKSTVFVALSPSDVFSPLDFPGDGVRWSANSSSNLFMRDLSNNQNAYLKHLDFHTHTASKNVIYYRGGSVPFVEERALRPARFDFERDTFPVDPLPPFSLLISPD